MHLRWKFGSVLLLSLAALAPAQSPSPAPAASPRPGLDAVWVPPAGTIDAMHAALERNPDTAAALEAGMRAGKASPAALAFAKRLGEDAGYIGDAHAAGPLTVGTLYFPLRANENAEPFVIDATGRLIRPAQIPIKTEDLRKQPGFAAVKHPDEVATWPPHQPPVPGAGAGAGQVFIYEFPLRTCHACPTEGVVHVAFVFGPDGHLLGRKVLDVSPPPPEPEPSAR